MSVSLAKGAVYLTISALFFVISGYSVNIFLGRHLGPSLYGLYGVVITLMSLINLLQTSGVPQALSKFTSESKIESDGVLKSALILQSILTAIIVSLFYFFSAQIATIFRDQTLRPYIQLAAFIFPFYGFYALQVGYFNGLHNFKKQAIVNIVYALAKIIGIIGLSSIFYLKGALVGFIVAPFAALLFGFRLPKGNTKPFPYKKLIIFSIPLIGFSLVLSLQQTIDLLFVKTLIASREATGYYAAGQNISLIPFFALSAFSAVLYPSISKNVSLNLHEKSRQLILQSLRYVLLALTPIVVLISATSRETVALLYSVKYAPAAAPLSILIFGIGFVTVFAIFATILNGAGHPRQSLVISSVGVCITAFFCFMLIPRFDLVGAALATTIGSFVAMCIAGFFVYQWFKTLISIQSLVKILLSSGVIYVLAKSITYPLLLLPLFYVCLLSVYVFLLAILKEITQEDWKMVRSLVPVLNNKKL